MENKELIPEKNILEQLREAIANSAAGIENEFAGTANGWLSCFETRMFLIETYLSLKKVEELLPPEKYLSALSRMEKLKERLSKLKKQYPDKDTVPPEITKQELIERLDIFKES